MRSVIGVIPARWGSTRFPGKILHPLCGRPLLAWVAERARAARRLDALLIATDDPRIEAAATALGLEAVRTSPDHPSGTDRVAEAIRGRKADGVVNIQGDEPMVDPALIDRLAEWILEGKEWDMATAATPISDPALIANPSVVKIVTAEDGRALYFSRAVIPFPRDPGDPLPAGPVYVRHIGLYAYRTDFLRRLVAAPPCASERIEKLEQLRALHLGGRIRVLMAEAQGPGVDTPEDVPAAEAALRAAGRVKENR
jgi:3-deoxy-manno-octulosonate cytidylyltransferase (CMP-KDO synthetase)